jgi:hypothetical protein
MPLRHKSNSVTGFLGVRMRPSDRFVADISKDGVWWWLGTFDNADEAAHAYGTSAWCFSCPRRDLNFPDVESMAEAEFLAPLM